MITKQEIQDAWTRLMRPDGWQQADGGRVTFRSQIIDGVKYIDFQGSIERADWLMDFDICPLHGYHGGYYKAFMKSIDAIPIEDEIPHIISGYSCGGAFALMIAEEVYSFLPWPSKIITFAAPRITNMKQITITPYVEIVNVQVTGDPVVHLPPRWLGYRDNPGQVMRFSAPLSIKAHSPAAYGAFIKGAI